jgi:hypothetical protein
MLRGSVGQVMCIGTIILLHLEAERKIRTNKKNKNSQLLGVACTREKIHRRREGRKRSIDARHTFLVKYDQNGMQLPVGSSCFESSFVYEEPLSGNSCL